VQAAFERFQPDTVIHLAAIHFIPECDAKPDEAVAINTQGTVNMLRACGPGTRFVLASTAAVYSAEERPHDEESSAVRPLDVYGLTKLHAEQYVRLWAGMRSLDARIVRLFNVIGPGETNPHILPAVLAQALRGVRVLRLGNCHPKRDYIHVEDAASGFAAIAMAPRRGAGVDVVNLGTGRSYSVYELVDELGRVVGEPFQIETDPARLRATDRPLVTASIEKARSQYNWGPRFSLTDSLRDLWRTPDIPDELLERS
jgi:UDP-glucose 4-epimerase